MTPTEPITHVETLIRRYDRLDTVPTYPEIKAALVLDMDDPATTDDMRLRIFMMILSEIPTTNDGMVAEWFVEAEWKPAPR